MKSQKGFTLVEGLIIIAVIGIIGFSGYYVANRSNNNTQLSTDSSESVELQEELPSDLQGLKSIEEIEAVAGVSDSVTILSYKLESSDSKTEYILVLSDGRKLVIDAVTGEVLSEETTDVSSYSGDVPINMSLKEALALATSRYDNPVKEIEFELEDKKATYKIEYMDGSKVEIDASTGTVVKAETKDEKYEKDSDDEHEVEHEEDHDDHDEEDHEHEEEHEEDHDEEDEEDNEDERDS